MSKLAVRASQAFEFMVFFSLVACFATACKSNGVGSQYDAVYCESSSSVAKVFAAKLRADGGLSFGVNIWLYQGNQIGVFGVAYRSGDHWEYKSNINAGSSADRCKLTILLPVNGAPQITADPDATCQSQGGYGTEIGFVKFSPSDYENNVTNELDDSETFFLKAGKCWRK